MLKTMRVPTTPQRSRMMSSIRGKDTWPERTLRSLLFARGFRYRLHVRKLPGSPDLVFPKHGAVVFVHGCFWHRHRGCKIATMPHSHVKFWAEKFRRNVANDARHRRQLRRLGWQVVVVWSCQLKHSDRILAKIEKALKPRRPICLQAHPVRLPLVAESRPAYGK